MKNEMLQGKIAVVLPKEEKENNRLKIERIKFLEEESFYHYISSITKGFIAGLFGITSILYGTDAIKSDTSLAKKLTTGVCAVSSGLWTVGAANSVSLKKETDEEITEIKKDVFGLR